MAFEIEKQDSFCILWIFFFSFTRLFKEQVFLFLAYYLFSINLFAAKVELVIVACALLFAMFSCEGTNKYSKRFDAVMEKFLFLINQNVK